MAIDSISEFTPKALGELKAWLETYYNRKPTPGATDDVGGPWGVRSGVSPPGYVLTSTGDEGSTWAPATPSLTTLISNHITIGDLISWWRMGEPAGNLLDYAQNPLGDKPLIPTVIAAPHVTYDVTGGLTNGDDGAVQFNFNQSGVASQDAFSAQDSTNHRWRFRTTSQPFTIECLVKPTSTWASAGDHGIVGSSTVQSGSGLIGWILGATRGTGGIVPYLLRANPSTTNTATSSVTCPYDAWSHIAATYDGTRIRIYVNGVLAGSAASTLSATGSVSTDVIVVGAAGYYSAGSAATAYFYGVIDEVVVYDAAMTAGEILEHAAGGVDLPATVDAGSFVVYANGA